MSDNTAYETNLEHARNLSAKFNYFFIGLTFSILALAVQNSTDSSLLIARIFELVGWLFLFLSGLFGLLRLQRQPRAYEVAANLASRMELQSKLKKIELEGGGEFFDSETKKPLVLEEIIKDSKESLKVIEEGLDEIESKMGRQYGAQTWMFLIGVSSILISHGYEKVCFILEAIK